MRKTVALTSSLLLALPLAACGDDGGSGGEDSADDVTLTVFAAASLTSTFEAMEKPFEAANPGIDVRFSFGGSSDLVAQIMEGAEAHVFAAADTKTMDQLVAAGLHRGDPAEFATNTLTIAVPPGNPAGVQALADLGEDDLDVVVCAPEVPCGNAAVEVAEAAGVTLAPDSEEQSVTDVLGKIEAGEGDAGLVYVTDVAAAGDTVEGIAFRESADVVNHYPIVRTEDGPVDHGARRWIEFVLSDAGQAILADAGFGPPAS